MLVRCAGVGGLCRVDRSCSRGTCRGRRGASRGRSTRTASPITSMRRPTARASVDARRPAADRDGRGVGALAGGLRQRARLLNAVAADIYGAQTLSDWPAAAGARVPASGIPPGLPRRSSAGGVFLHLVASTSRAGPDGVWRVVATRTQAPSGAGYALENRATISRAVPRGVPGPAGAAARVVSSGVSGDAACGAPAVAKRRTSCCSRRAVQRDLLRTRLPGQAARVPAGRGRRSHGTGRSSVSEDGLRTPRVHAILRRLDDDFCDPLELRSESALGVPGLVQAWRAGHVLVANAFGMGVLESPALLAFLPSICERLLGEALGIPSLATWWGGEAAGSTQRSPSRAV